MNSEKIDVHDYEKRIEGYIRLINNSKKICDENKKILKDYMDYAKYKQQLKDSTLSKNLGRYKKVAEMLGEKSFKKINKNDVDGLFKKLYGKVVDQHFLKSFCSKYLKKPEYVSDIRIKNEKGLPGDYIKKEDVLRMIEATPNIRDKALIGVLYESGCRIGEILSLRIKDISFDENGAVLRVNGKTGDRRVRIIGYARYLAEWISNHPRKEEHNAPLWHTLIKSNSEKDYVEYHSVAILLKRLAKKCGVKKRVNPHSFRHCRATELANNLTEAQMKAYFGWTQGSDMASVYVHLSGKDVDDAILEANGIKKSEKEKKKNEAIKCSRCNQINPSGNKICGVCGLPLELDIKTVLEMEERKRLGEKLLTLAMKNEKILKIIAQDMGKESYMEEVKRLAH